MILLIIAFALGYGISAICVLAVPFYAIKVIERTQYNIMRTQLVIMSANEEPRFIPIKQVQNA